MNDRFEEKLPFAVIPRNVSCRPVVAITAIHHCIKMDEFQLVETYREGFAVAWAQLQWWASVSFGLLALAGFGRRHLSLAVTIGLSTLYLLFSVFSLVNVYLVLVPVATAAGDLSQLEVVSNVGASVFGNRRVGQANALIAMACFVATFCGTLTYLWHSHRKNKAAAA